MHGSREHTRWHGPCLLRVPCARAVAWALFLCVLPPHAAWAASASHHHPSAVESGALAATKAAISSGLLRGTPLLLGNDADAWALRGLGRLLMQGDGAAAGDMCQCTGNCSQGPAETVSQVVEHFGGLPTLRHYNYLFQEQLEAQGSQSTLCVRFQTFNNPTDLTPVATLDPLYDIALVEQRMPPAAQPPFAAPAWLVDGTTDDATLQQSLMGLLAQGSELIYQQPVLLVYRRDILDAQGVSVPETWDQMLQVAAALNGTDMNADGEGDYALCVDVDWNCKSYWLVSAIAASMLQYNGTATGYLIDPITGDSLLNTSGFIQALAMWGQLMQYNSPEQAPNTKYCGVWEDAFTEGRCLFTLGYMQTASHTIWAQGFDDSSPRPKGYAWGRTGVAPTPGSTVVYDRSSGTVVPCNPQLCPLATPAQPFSLPSGPASDRRLHAVVGGGQAPMQAPASGTYVNRAPVVVRNDNSVSEGRTNKVTALNLKVFSETWNINTVCWMFLAFDPAFYADPAVAAASKAQNVDAQLGPDFNLMYYNSSHYVLDLYAWVQTLRDWAATVGWIVSDPNSTSGSSGTLLDPIYPGVAEYMGIEGHEALDHLRAATWSMVHRNVVPDPQMVSPLRISVANAAAQIVQGVDPSLVQQDIVYNLWLWSQEPASWWTQEEYNSDVGYVPPPPPSPAGGPERPSGGGGSPGMSAGSMAGVVVGSTIGGMLLLAGALWALRSRSKAGLDLFGKVRHPDLGPLTSAVVTDIQSSTTLWEVLPAGVMDRAVRLHHQLMRSLMQEHKGYETCTEGDSFIIAFHTPWDALRYCLAVQSELLSVEWPEELLACPEAAEDAGDLKLQYNAGTMDWCNARAPSRSYLLASDSDPPVFTARPSRLARWKARLLGKPQPDAPLSSSPTQPRDSRSGSVSGMDQIMGPGGGGSPEAGEPTEGEDSQEHRHRAAAGLEMTNFTTHGGGGDGSMGTTSPEPHLLLTLEDGLGGGGGGGIGGGDGGSSMWSKEGSMMREGESGREGTGKAASLPRKQQQQQQQQRWEGQGSDTWQEGCNLEAWLTSQVRHPSHGGSCLLDPTPFALVNDNSEQSTSSAPRGAARAGVEALAFRGLRVRMGLHAGVTDPRSWVVNTATGRWCFSGPFLAKCKAVADTGVGGTIVLSRSFYHALVPFGLPPDCVVLHMGEHQLKDVEGTTPLYLALPSKLACRLAVLPPLRSLALTSPSILSAPMGHAAVVFMHAVGVNTLRAWNAELTRDAVRVYHEAVSRTLLEWGGYLVEQADGLCLASFSDAGAAVGWALSAQADLLTQEWDRRLLRHELCEEVAVMVHASSAEAEEPITPHAALSPRPSERRISRRSFKAAGAALVAPLVEQVSLRAMRVSMPTSFAAREEREGLLGPAEEERKSSTGFMGFGKAKERTSASSFVHKRVLLRGLRIKAGIDVGEVHASLSPSTGRMAYWGKCMNRAARIAGHATSSQVLCSALAWSASCSSTLPRLQATPVVGSSLGAHTLKGIADKVTIMHCTLDPEQAAAAAAVAAPAVLA